MVRSGLAEGLLFKLILSPLIQAFSHALHFYRFAHLLKMDEYEHNKGITVQSLGTRNDSEIQWKTLGTKIQTCLFASLPQVVAGLKAEDGAGKRSSSAISSAASSVCLFSPLRISGLPPRQS